VGAAHVAQQSRPDAHTLLFTGAGLASSMSLARLSFDPLRDLTAVAGAGAIPSLVVVSPQSPLRDMASLLAAARAAPGRLTYGSSGPGTGSHLAGALLARAAGIEITHVPYRGSGAVYPDLIAQRITMLLDIMASSGPQAQQGAVRALATTSDRRSEALPEVPTVAEAGVPGYAFATWVGLFTRAGAPETSLRRLESAVLAALGSAPMRERLRLAAADPIPSDMAGFGAYVRADAERWAEMVRDGALQRED
jgi:tripartite-type tricarboxylate transporter receptor subunit TctC